MSPSDLSLVITAHRTGPEPEDCLRSAAALSPAPREVIVVTDGRVPEVEALAVRLGFRVVPLPDKPGVSAARNAGAAAAGAPIIVFADSDVLLPAAFAAQAAQIFAAERGAAAVIGSYDDAPAAPQAVSRFRNLLHHHTHQRGSREAGTFWAACGAVRADAFRSVGGFDPAIRQASIEDIELGRRLRRAGHRIVLEPTWQVRHLKRWRLGGMVRTDIFDRAAPWTLLLLREGRADNDLNLDHRSRASAALFCVAAAALPAAVWWPPALAVAVCSAGTAVWLNRDFYALLTRRGGTGFAAACVPLHALHFLCAAAGLVIGITQHILRPGRRNQV